MSDTLEDAATASTPATESTTSGSSVVEQSGTLVNKLMLEYTLFEDTNDQGITRSLLEGAEKTASDQKQGRTDGMKKFLDFNHTLSKQDAKRVKREHKGAKPAVPDLSLKVIQGVHRMMMMLKEDESGNALAYDDLVFFLAVCNNSLEFDKDLKLLEYEVDNALDAVKFRQICDASPTTSNVKPINYHIVLSGIKDTIDQLVICGKRSDQQAVEQDDGAVTPAGNDLVNKIGKTVEVANLQYLFEKVQHAVQYTSTDADMDKLSQLSEQIGSVLTVREQ